MVTAASTRPRAAGFINVVGNVGTAVIVALGNANIADLALATGSLKRFIR
jgi:hypothetical protein